MYKVVFTHKKCSILDGYVKIDNRKSDLDHRLYSEIAGYDVLMKMFNDAENAKSADTTGKTNPEFPPIWIQTNHYRRVFDIDCCNRTYIAQPMIFPCTIAQQYGAMHYIEDLKTMCNAIRALYPTMINFAEQVLNQNIFIPYNMVTCQYGQFRDYAQFLISVLKKVAEYMGNPTFEQMKDIISKREQPNVEGRNNDISYQSRIYSFLSERVSTIYWLAIAKQMPVYPAKVNLLEEGQKI